MRIIRKYAYICYMKSRLNLTIDKDLMEQAKRYAEKANASLSQLVEDYFKNLSRPVHKKSAIDLIGSLPQPKNPINGDYKKDYFNKRKAKYGF